MDFSFCGIYWVMLPLAMPIPGRTYGWSGLKVGDVIPLPLICPTWRVPDLHAWISVWRTRPPTPS